MTEEITEETAVKAADYIRDHAEEHAQAKSNRVQLEHFRQSKLSMLFNQSPMEGVAAKEHWARAHPDYLAVLDGIKIAVEAEERIKWLMTAAELKIALYRTKSANDRKV